MCVCVCVCVGGCVFGWVGRPGCKITKNKKTLESIEINQFCFKIYDLWKNLHLCGLKVVGHLGVVGCLEDSVCVCVCVCVCVTLIHSIKYNWGYLQPPVLEGRILNGFGFGFRVPVSGFGDQVNLKCILKACVCATFL